MTSSPFVRRLTFAALTIPCVAAVVIWGELSPVTFVAVGITGGVVTGVGLAGRAGEAAAPVGRRGLPWLGWLAAAVSWELVTLADGGMPTVSDLADPLLAHPALRGAATICWLAAGAWLVARPRRRPRA